jgi:3-hydroxyisobutyrate dehydrogenase-like beta-hydroxyacid dehydrogenase
MLPLSTRLAVPTFSRRSRAVATGSRTYVTSVGVVGVGAMGEAMAESLLRAGFAVAVCAHRNRAPVERLVAAGARDAGDAAGVAHASDVVITIVPDAPQVEEALFGPHGALVGARPQTLFIDMSTISPVATRAFDERLRAAGHRFIDAPVSGGPPRAKLGTLALMIGGSAADVAAAEPVLRALGTPNHVGDVGMGETVKLVNQIIISNIMLANIEGLVFAERAGADVARVRDVILTATGANYLLEKWLPTTWLAGTFTPGFALDLLRKDLAAALDAGRAMQVPMPSSALAYQLYTAASADGHGSDDYSAVATFHQRTAGANAPGKA